MNLYALFEVGMHLDLTIRNAKATSTRLMESWLGVCTERERERELRREGGKSLLAYSKEVGPYLI